MYGFLTTEFTVLFQFQSIRRILLVLIGAIIPILALGTGQRNPFAHLPHLQKKMDRKKQPSGCDKILPSRLKDFIPIFYFT